MLRKPLLWILVLGAVLSAGPAAAAETRKMWLDLYLEFETVADPQISPDGAQIVYTRRWVDKVNDKWESSLWIMSADGSKNRFLAKGASPRWSPDGTRIAYLADGEPKGQQIFVRWMDAEGAVTQITRVEKTPGNLSWSPDGEWLAFTMLVPKKESWKITLPARPEGAKWSEDPRIIERLVYRRDRIGFLEEGYRHLFVVPATGGTPRQLTSGDFDHGSSLVLFGAGGDLSWTPDGKEIVFTSLRTPDWEYAWLESEIYAVNVADKSIRQLTTRKGPDETPVVSPDGRWVAYTGHDWSDDTYVDSKLYVMGIDGSNPRVLTFTLDRSPADLR